MVKKQQVKKSKQQKRAKIAKPLTVSRRKAPQKRGITLFKATQSNLKQLSNYRNFMKYLLYSNIDNGLADESN